MLIVLAAPLPARQPAPTSWQHAGSDIPADPAWRTGTLDNGLRYAVRRGVRPPGSIAVRIRIDAGALMESDPQQGWTHLLEHMLFRGTRHYLDGEGIRVWQRLGASFGSDSNAQTSLSATTFILDLPKADTPSYTQAMDVLAEMMSSATIDPRLLAIEQKVVVAERALRMPPLTRAVQATTRALFLAGTKAGQRDIIGDETTIGGATVDRLRAYYHAWYRPERAVVVVVGDADPDMLEQVVRDKFGGWAAAAPSPTEPVYGTPAAPSRSAAVVVHRQAPSSLTIGYVVPHDDRPWTVARQRQMFAEQIATAILAQRMSTEAQKGEAIVSAGVGWGRQRHAIDRLNVQLVPKAGAWADALHQAMALLNGASAAPPAQAEIDQQAASLADILDRAVTAEPTMTSGALADGYVGDVDRGDVSGAPAFYRDLFAAGRAEITPAAIGAIWRRTLSPEPRLLLLSPTPVDGGDAAALAALDAARRTGANVRTDVRAVSIDELILPATPGHIVSANTIADLGIERIRFANGVELDLKKTSFEKDRIRLQMMIGHGVLGEKPGEAGLGWTSSALLAAGIGPFTPDELARLTAGRRMSVSIQPGTEALTISGGSNDRDVGDMLKLMAGALTEPRYLPTPLARMRDAATASYQSIYSDPGAVFRSFGTPLLYGGDERFRAMPPLADIQGVRLADYQAYWEKRLAEGPIRVAAVGDFDRDALVAAVARTIGALPARIDRKPDAGQIDVRAVPPAASPTILRHRGDPGQALVARVYPTQGFLEDIRTARALEVAAQIIQTRLTEEFREQQGGTYSPFVSSSQSAVLPHHGILMAGAQIEIGRIADFMAALDTIVADLAERGPNADAFARARATSVSAAERARSDNGYWLGVLRADLDDPKRLESIRGFVSSRAAVEPSMVQAVTRVYLARPGKGFEIRVLPEPAEHE